MNTQQMTKQQELEENNGKSCLVALVLGGAAFGCALGFTLYRAWVSVGGSITW